MYHICIYILCIVVVDGLSLYVGEDSGGVASSESGVGNDIAHTWEHALRQALMPVTPKSSVQMGKILSFFRRIASVVYPIMHD